MPNGLTIAETPDRLAVLQNIGHDVELGQASDEASSRLLNRRDIQFAKSTAERDQLRIRQSLPAKKQHEVGEPCAVDHREGAFIQCADIDAADFRCESAAAGYDFGTGRHARHLMRSTPSKKPHGDAY